MFTTMSNKPLTITSAMLQYRPNRPQFKESGFRNHTDTLDNWTTDIWIKFNVFVYIFGIMKAQWPLYTPAIKNQNKGGIGAFFNVYFGQQEAILHSVVSVYRFHKVISYCGRKTLIIIHQMNILSSSYKMNTLIYIIL